MEDNCGLFQANEKKIGVWKEYVAKRSMRCATLIERNLTIRQSKDVKYDAKHRLGIAASLDMHWPQRGSGKAFNSDSGASYLVGVLSQLIIEACVFCKSCRVCYEFLKKKRDGKVGANAIAPEHRC